MPIRFILGILLGLAWVSLASADPPAATTRPFWQRLWPTTCCPPVGCCPDDYVRKPMPSICPLPRCGTVDDYCRKPQPCVPALPRCGLPDDYCRKTLPCLLCPTLSPYLQCGTPEDRCPDCGRRRLVSSPP